MTKAALEAAISSLERWTIIFTVIGAMGAVGLAICAWRMWGANARLRPIQAAEARAAEERIAQLHEETARAQLETEKIREKLAPRSLTSDQQSAIGAEIARFAGQNAAVLPYAGDPEIQAFAETLAETLRRAGWHVEVTPVVVLSAASSGVDVRVLEGAPAHVEAAADALAHALDDERVPVTETKGAKKRRSLVTTLGDLETTVTLMVGRK